MTSYIQSYPEVVRSMLLSDPHYELSSLIKPEGVAIHLYAHAKRDPSYIRLLQELEQQDVLNPSTLFLFTANSAIPFADSLRGVFAARGMGSPRVGYIQTKSPCGYRGRDASTIEAQRISARLQNVRKVAITDQYVFRGNTISLANRILDTAKAITGSTATNHLVMGDWYADLFGSDGYTDECINYDTVSIPATADLMFHLGYTAACLAGNHSFR